MLRTLQDLLRAVTAPSAMAPPAAAEHTLQLATAVLLVEVMRSDAELHADERSAVILALRDRFSLAPDELERLLELALETAREATDFFAFTSRINAVYTMEQKVWMVEQLWRVAYADGTLSAHENHVMRRLSDLLHVPHGAYINAKMRAQPLGGGDAKAAQA